MKSTSSIFHDKYYHHCSKKERWLNMGRLAPFLLCSLGLTSIFSYFVLNSPYPLKFKSQHDPAVDHHYQTNINVLSHTPKHDHLDHHHQNNINVVVSPTPKHDLIDHDQINNNNNVLNQPHDDQGEENCDLFKGHWIPDMKGPLYTNSSCPTIPISKNCFLNGRMDRDFLNWRWKPDGCELARFEPKTFLKIVRGKKLAFIGDSVARNQMESLLCLLSQEEMPTDIYKDSEDRFRTWYFPNHDFTLMIIWTKFLVLGEERQINGSLSGIYDLHLDKIDSAWSEKLPGIDYAIISDAHWFFRQLYLHEGSSIRGCVYCNEPEIKDVGVSSALKLVFRHALDHINKCKDCSKGMVTLVRTFSPAHFENGTWDTGGNCERTSPQSEGEIINLGASNEWELRSIQVEEIERARKEGETRGKKFGVLDITRAMLMRPDGHPGSHWDNQWMKGFNDCVHWCMPGPIDAWNDLLLAVLRKEADFLSLGS